MHILLVTTECKCLVGGILYFQVEKQSRHLVDVELSVLSAPENKHQMLVDSNKPL